MTKSNSRDWLMIGVTGAACVACCAPLLAPLIAPAIAGAGALVGGRALGFSIGQIACGMIFAAMAAAATVLVVRRRRRAKPTCGCTQEAENPVCAIDRPCDPAPTRPRP